MESFLVDQHWMWMFGVEAAEFASPLTVIEHRSPFFENYKGAWIFEHKGCCIVTVPPPLRDEIVSKIATIPDSCRLTKDCARELFGDRMLHVIGPVYQGALEPDYFKPFTRHATRLLTSNDRGLLETLLSECDPADVEDSGVRMNSMPLHGCFVNCQLVSVAKEIDISPYAMQVGILSHPSFRGQGYGKAAVSAAVTAIFAQGKVVCYQTLSANATSVALATALGHRDYARHLAVRLRM